MIRACSNNGELYLQKGMREKFWEEVRLACIREFKRKMGHCRNFVKTIMEDFEADLVLEQASSGEPIPDTSLKQACWNWKTKWLEKVYYLLPFVVHMNIY